MRAAPIVLVGAGGLGRELLVLIRQINQALPTWQILGFYDDNSALTGKQFNDIPCLGSTDDLANSPEPLAVVIAIGSPETKKQVVQKLSKNSVLTFPALVHPQVNVQPFQYLQIGEGSIITAGCQVTTNINIGRFVLLNLNCTVGHDAVVEDFCSLMPGVHMSGEVTIEKECYLGTGSVVLNRMKIGQQSVVGAGAVVTRNIPSGSTVVGIPARPTTAP